MEVLPVKLEFQADLNHKVLYEIGLLARSIKNYLKQNLIHFKTVENVVLYIQDMVRSKGYRLPFPTLILPGHFLSNRTPLNSEMKKALDTRYCTIDFGIQSGSWIVDTAITLLDQPEVVIYRNCLKKAISQLNTLSSLTVNTISKVITHHLKGTGLYLIKQCGSHFIRPNLLHGQPIILGQEVTPDIKIIPGDVFTIQPHVSVGPSKVYFLPPSIVLKKQGYDTIENRYYPAGEQMEFVDGLSVKDKGFYQENTYIYTTEGLRVVT